MSETPLADPASIDLAQYSPELRQVIAFEQVPDEVLPMIVSIYEATESGARQAWNELPDSAQNILDNFAQFHALITVSQAFSGIELMESFAHLELPEHMSEEQKNDYRANLLDKTLYNCVKDMMKQLKKARRDPILKRDFKEIFLR